MIKYPWEILSFLYIGNVINANDVDTLNKLNIKTVISVWDKELKIKDEGNITYYNFYVNDDNDQNLYEYIPKINYIIDNEKEKGNILIHCYAGISRSAWFTIAYIMIKFNINYEDAYDYVLWKRNIINPNENFVNQLKKLFFFSKKKNMIFFQGNLTSMIKMHPKLKISKKKNFSLKI